MASVRLRRRVEADRDRGGEEAREHHGSTGGRCAQVSAKTTMYQELRHRVLEAETAVIGGQRAPNRNEIDNVWFPDNSS